MKTKIRRWKRRGNTYALIAVVYPEFCGLGVKFCQSPAYEPPDCCLKIPWFCAAGSWDTQYIVFFSRSTSWPLLYKLAHFSSPHLMEGAAFYECSPVPCIPDSTNFLHEMMRALLGIQSSHRTLLTTT